MNRSVDATISLPTTGTPESDEQDLGLRLDSIGRTDDGARISRENVDPVDRSEPDEPREGEAVLPAPDPKMPDPALARTKWSQEVRDAALEWSLLNATDLAALEGHDVNLTDLIQARYSLARDEANRQVTSFIKDHQLFAL